jgi:hypothetical protein
MRQKTITYTRYRRNVFTAKAAAIHRAAAHLGLELTSCWTRARNRINCRESWSGISWELTSVSSEQAGAVREASQTADAARMRAVYGGTGDFAIHVVRENGLPDVALTVFANDLRRILSDGSVRGYLRESLAL